MREPSTQDIRQRGTAPIRLDHGQMPPQVTLDMREQGHATSSSLRLGYPIHLGV